MNISHRGYLTAIALFVGSLSFLASPTQGDIIWSYESIGYSGQTLTGTLTTTGTPGEEFGGLGLIFDLISIDTVELNGNPITDWFLTDAPPPLTNAPAGSIRTSYPWGTAELILGSKVQVFSPGKWNYVRLSDTFWTEDTEVGTHVLGGPIVSFKSRSTTFRSMTVVPEPSAFLCLGLMGLWLVGWRKLRVRKKAKH